MAFILFLFLAAKVFVSGASGDLVCVLADAAQGAVWTVGLDPPSIDLNAGRCLMGNPMLDLCYSTGYIYIAGPTSTLPGADPYMGGHIARIDSVTCAPEIIAQFPTAVTAIGCDDSRLVFALKDVGIKSITHNGSDEQDHRFIEGAFIRNIFVDILTQTSYSVDINTHLVYIVDYTVSITASSESLNPADDGAVGVTLDYECQNGNPTELWGYNSDPLSFSVPPQSRIANQLQSSAPRKIVLSNNSPHGPPDELIMTFALNAEVYLFSTEYRANEQIQLELFQYGNVNAKFSELLDRDDNSNKWKEVTWRPAANVEFGKAVLSFGNFNTTGEVKLRNYIFEVCPESSFRRRRSAAESAESVESATGTRTPYLNILYDDCRVERCPVDGPYIGCRVIREPSESQNCLPMSGTADKVLMHDDTKTLIAVDPYTTPPAETTTRTNFKDVVGMDCFIRYYDPRDDVCDQSDPKPCLNNGTCVVTLAGYHCFCPEGFIGRRCETPCPRCRGFSISQLRDVMSIFGITSK